MLGATSVALILLAASPARADRRLAVVELATPPSMIGLGSQLTGAVVRSAREQGYTVIPPEMVRATLGEKALEELQECKGAPGCVAGKLAGVRASRAVVGSLDRDERSYLFKLWLIDLRQGQVVSTVDRAILIASRRLMPDAREAIPHLLRGEKEEHGTLKLSSNVTGAQVSVDGQPVGQTPLSLELKPGKHQVRLEKKSYLAMERLVVVEANRTTEEQLPLLLAPGARPPEEKPKWVAQARPTARESRPAAQEPGLRVPAGAWAGYLVALAATGGAVYFGSRSQRTELQLKSGYDPASNTYRGTRAQALEGVWDARAANVLFGAAGAAAAVGVTLTIIENNQPAPAVQVAPAAGAGGAGVLVEGRF